MQTLQYPDNPPRPEHAVELFRLVSMVDGFLDA